MFNFLSPRIGLRALAGLCRRLSTALEAGIDVRRVLGREASGRGGGVLRRQLERIRERVDRGETVARGIEAAGDYFPPLFRDLVAVGEQSGHLPETLRQLAEHYEHQLELRRTFLSSITWPLIQLTVAVSVVGFLIWIMGMIQVVGGKPVDILGLGLIGTEGLVAYLGFVAVVAAVGIAIAQGIRRGMLWVRPLQSLAMRVPVLSQVLETLALARLCWTMNLTFHTGMPVLQAVPLCLKSTNNVWYTWHTEAIVGQLRAGEELSEAFAATRAFPTDFLEALDVGERSGRISETMALLANQYRDRARRALTTLNVLAGFVVWAVVAALIVALIFRLFSFYIGAINDAMKP